MMNTADNLNHITDLITQTLHRVSLLNECLLEELDILKSNNAEELITISEKKETLMRELNEIDCQRKDLTRANQIKSKEQYLQWLDTLDPTTELKKQWLEVGQQILACQNQNSCNGIISENMASASQQALNIISGNNTPAHSTYTSSGKKPAQSSSLHKTTA
ncbi:MAG: flagellar protein FlgN [Gammaproteobacteria bacterium]|nr:flagellar protein FlgN [Gammaproteobacteria bacterium]